MAIIKNEWHWPRLIAHRGGGVLAPENTLAALRTGLFYGFRMVEYDVKLSNDKAVILLHDDTIDRTSDGTGQASIMNLNELMKYDFGSWYSKQFAGEPLANLHSIAKYTISNKIYSNIELKPSYGLEEHTGIIIAEAIRNLWAESDLTPLISSFSETALYGFMRIAPEFPKALLIEDNIPSDWQYKARALRCTGININEQLLDQYIIADIIHSGYTVAAWTVNNLTRARQLLNWGCSAVFTDALNTINPNTV